MVNKPYKIVTVPDPRLKVVAIAVEKVDPEIKLTLDRMLTTMYHYNGIGLAATQAGINKRLIVMDIPHNIDKCQSEEEAEELDKTHQSTIYKMVNPIITHQAQATAKYMEGCLSVPGQNAEIERPSAIELTYTDENNQECHLSATGLLATCIQHEIDHLNGILYIDYLSDMKKNILIKKSVKYAQEQAK